MNVKNVFGKFMNSIGPLFTPSQKTEQNSTFVKTDCILANLHKNKLFLKE